jgi:outer membrane receptor protein involved in Fe transport
VCRALFFDRGPKAKLGFGKREEYLLMMTSTLKTRLLASGTALQALALLGAGITGSAIMVAPVAAQDVTTGILSGTVVGESGAGIPGARVTITSTDRGNVRESTASNNGTFTVSQLPVGTYSVTVVAEGFATTRADNVQVNLGGNSYTFTLGVADAAGDAIVVLGTPKRTVDFSGTATGVVFDVKTLADEIPVPRSIEAVQLLAPQATQGDSAFGNVISLGGSSVAENIYYVNGMNVTNFRTFVGGSTIPFEFYDQVQIKTGGYQAEFGRATGGAVIAVTRSGTNEFRGGFNAYWSPGSLRAKQPNTYAANNELDRVKDVEGNIYLSGPIIKDRLFAFAFINPRHRSSFAQSINPTGGAIVTQSFSETTTPFYGGKIDANIIDGHTLELTYFNDSNTQRSWTRPYNSVTDTAAGEKTYINDFSGGENYIAKYTGNFTDWLTVSALYGRSKFRRSTLSAADNDILTYDSRQGVSQFTLLQGSGLVEDGKDDREFYRADADLYFNALGSHHLRFGADHEILTAEANAFYSGGEYNRLFNSSTYNPFGLPAATDYLRQRIYRSGGTFEAQNTAFYIQDNWDATDRLQLSLGVRNDRFKNLNAAGNTFTDLKNQWAPRLGASFDVTGDKRTRLSAFYGRYYLPVAANTNIRLAGDELFTEDWYTYTGDPLNPTIGTKIIPTTVYSDSSNPDPTTLVSTNLKPQYLDEFIVGFEKRVGERWKFGVNGIYRTLGAVLEDADLSHYAVGQYCAANPTACGGESTLDVGGGGYVLLNPGSDAIINVSPQGGFAGGVLTIPAEFIDLPVAKRKYYAVEALFERSFDGRWGLQGSYVWSRSRGNYEGGVKSDNGQDDVGLTQDFDEPGWMDGSHGFLPNHRAHQFKVFGTYAPVEWFRFGLNARVSSPRKYGCIGVYPINDGRAQNPFRSGGADSWYCGDRSTAFDTNNDGVADTANNSVLVGRGNAFEGKWEKRIDLALQFRPQIEQFRSVSFRVDVFNLFNFDSPVDFNEYGDADGPLKANGNVPLNVNYMKPTQYQTPRYVRFGLSFDF